MVWAAVGMALSVALTWVMLMVSGRMTRRFRDKVTIALETHVARLQATIGTVAHHERAEYLDRLAVLRNQIFVLDHMYMAVLSTLSWIVRLVITIALLMSVNPLLILLAVFALPTVATSSIRPTREREVEEQQAVHQRLSEHLFLTATTAAAGKEVRISGIGDPLVRDRRAEWDSGTGRWPMRASHCDLARAGLGRVRHRLRPSRLVRGRAAGGLARRGAADPRRRCAAVGLRRIDRR